MGLLTRYLDWRLRNVVTIETGEEAFRIRRGRSERSIHWQSIDTVTAFKRDLLTVDCLCLLVRHGDAAVELDAPVELNDRMGGFTAWLIMLETRLNIDREWRLSVLFPAFETNATVLFHREPADAALGKPA